jgi:hypothetical protein
MRGRDRALWQGYDLVTLGTARIQHPGRTILADDMPLVCYGVIFIYAHYAYLWSFFGAQAPRHRFTLVKTLYQEWRALLSQYSTIQRVETYTVLGDQAAERLMLHLGFTRGVLKPWHNPQGGSNYEWTWIRGEKHG